MPAWNSSIGSECDLQDPALWNMLINAIDERRRALLSADALDSDVDAGFVPGTPFAAGDDITDLTAIPIMQSSVVDLLGAFLNHTREATWLATPYTDDLFSPISQFWSMADARAEADLPVTKYYEFVDMATDPTYFPDDDGSLLRRRRYRQVKHIGDNRDVWGNLAATGHRAYFCGSSWPGDTVRDISKAFLGTPLSGIRLRYTGITWVRDDSEQADILDNTMDTPFCIPNDPGSCYSGIGPSLERGELQPGDIIDCSVAEEMRVLIDLMRWTLNLPASFPGSTTGSKYKFLNNLDTGAFTTFAAMKASVQAAYAAQAPINSILGWIYGIGTNAQHVPFNFPEYICGFITSVYQSYKTRSYTNVFSRKIRTYAVGDYNDASAVNREFDDGGLGLSFHAWSKFGPDFGPTNARNAHFEYGDPTLAEPTWPTHVVNVDENSTVTVADHASRSAKILRQRDITLWNVAGGFQYVTQTD